MEQFDRNPLAIVKEHQLAPAMGGWFVFLAREFIYEIAYTEGKQHMVAAILHLLERVQAGQEDSWV